MPETVVASACLCGVVCRWHGRKAPKPKIIKQLEAAGINVIPVCPETLADFPTPRSPVKTRRGRIYETDAKRIKLGRELTKSFQEGAQKALKIAQAAGARQAYFFKTSPSCAISGIAGKMFIEAGIEVTPVW
jgi:uncharacterized protein YbbK (DUF523 family)